MEFEFGELKNDTNFKTKVTNILNCFEKLDKQIDNYVNCRNYDELSTEKKVKYDLAQVYSLNSLYWMYLKIQGLDPNDHGIKNELSRVREVMIRQKAVHERNTIRPVIDQGAANRFVKHGLKIKNINKPTGKQDKRPSQNTQLPINKKIKFTENLSDNDEK